MKVKYNNSNKQTVESVNSSMEIDHIIPKKKKIKKLKEQEGTAVTTNKPTNGMLAHEEMETESEPKPTKVKKIKNIKKQQAPAMTTNGMLSEVEVEAEPELKEVKKIKKVKKQQVTADGEIEVKPKEVKEKFIKTVDSSIFRHFKELTNENDKKRTEAAFQLLQQLAKTNEPNKHEKEILYALKRLIRGCGAATNSARAGFYTGLVAMLKAYNTNDLSTQMLLDCMEKELHVGSTITNKEDADAVVGRILICGALLYAERITNASPKQLENITNTLIVSTNFRTYHSSLGYSIITELLEKVSPEQFSASIWPLLQKELSRPWSRQTVQTIHCIIVAQNKFPAIVNPKYMKTNFGAAELINDESHTHLYKIFWEHTNIDILTHPALEKFAIYAANCTKLSEFWQTTVDANLKKAPTKLVELITIKLLADILNNLAVERTPVRNLLSDNFMKMIIEGLKNLKQKNDDTFKAFYTELLEALVNCCSKLKEDNDKTAVIRRLVLHPGIFNIEKYTKTRVVHQLINFLGEDGVKEIYELYKSVFMANIQKHPDNSETWLNFERLNAGYMLQHLLQHKAMQKSYKWRKQQLLFLFTNGIFNVDDNMEICKKDSIGTFSKDFGDQCKKMFYTCLQNKLHDLHNEKNMLMKLAEYCNEQIQKKNVQKYLRAKSIDNSIRSAWQRMYEAVSTTAAGANKKQKKAADKANNNDDKLESIFHILLLNMGLQLFKEPEMAVPAIDDLIKCMQHTKEEKQQILKNHKKKQSIEENEEPEWIEVVVDLFLHLLSQNASALRNIVDAIFPHLCSNLTLNAVHHILSMLDMKDGHNPLSTKAELNDEEDDNGEEEEIDGKVANNEDEEVESDDADSEQHQTDEDDDDEDDDDDDEDEDEDEDDDDDEDDDEDAVFIEEEVSNTDKLRNAISQALMTSGAAALPQNSNDDDDDMASVDLNDITEEEGRKLDEALANAFRVLKKSNNSANQGKKTKRYRIQTTTVMHFRIRVLDLIEIYMQHNPALMILNEIMLALFDMLEYCGNVELKPLQAKVEKVLTKLTAIKSGTLQSIEVDLNEQNLVDFMRQLIEKKTPTVAYDLINKLRNKCVVFLINNATRICGSKRPALIIALFEEYVNEFIKSRNPIINVSLLNDIFRLRWSGVLDLALTLANAGINTETRAFRRIQIFELFVTLYNNNELPKFHLKAMQKCLTKIENLVKTFINSVIATATAVRQSPKEFQTLLELLINVQKAHTRMGTQSNLCSTETCNAIQQIRQHTRLETMHVYQRYCGAFKLKVIRNNDLSLNGTVNGLHNGDSSVASDAELDMQKAAQTNGGEPSAKIKNKNKRKADPATSTTAAVDTRKLKKQKKAQRLIAASRGLIEGMSFAQTNGHVDDEMLES